ncbi:helix-turn-helix domain-containing protein [Yinghuangia sp. YIM S09857]|uniref:helix-turn-helix domain-containing protein n=1 Tax=Yinghuangia sp. YIM S09857 TaxID=3436929 RepID=UPI003F531595
MNQAPEPTEDLGTLLKRVMKDADNMSQSELSRRTDVPVATLSAWINGTRRATDHERLRAIAERGGLPVTVRQLFAAAKLPLPAPADDARERRLVETWRGLTDADQRVLEATADALRKRREPENR